MAKMLVKNLEGVALDWAVAQCEKVVFDHIEHGKGGGIYLWLEPDFPDDRFVLYSPSTDGSQGGSIIDDAGISVIRCDDDYGVDRKGFTTSKRIPVWAATTGQFGLQYSYEGQVYPGGQYEVSESQVMYGPTRLVAAMRCTVGMTYGHEIEMSADKKVRDFAQAVQAVSDTGSAYMRAGDNGGVDPKTGKTKAELSALSDAQAAEVERLRAVANGRPSETSAKSAEQPEPKVVVHVDGGCIAYVTSSNPAIKVILHNADALREQGVSADRRDALLDAAGEGCKEVEIIDVIDYLAASIPEPTKAKEDPAPAASDASPAP